MKKYSLLTLFVIAISAVQAYLLNRQMELAAQDYLLIVLVSIVFVAVASWLFNRFKKKPGNEI